jgi:membrane protease YdiL (CAAX protease family)
VSRLPDTVLRLLKGSLLFFPVLTVLFWIGSPLGFWGAACLALLLELIPALSIAQMPLIDDETPLPRLPVYLSSAVLILVMGGLALLVGVHEFGSEPLGLGSFPWGPFALWVVGITSAALVLLWVFLRIRRAAGISETPLLVQLLPETPREKVVFVFLSISAGVGEELAYRGFLIPALTLVLGWSWGAAILSSLVFGLLHGYQGWLGVIRTALLGFVLASSFILSGVLWPAIVAHAILDVLAGIVLGETLVKE